MGAPKLPQRCLQQCFWPKMDANSLFHIVTGSCCSSWQLVAKCRFRRVGPPGGRPVVVGGHLGVAGLWGGPGVQNFGSGVAVCGCRAKVSEVGGVAVGGRVVGHETSPELRAVFRGQGGCFGVRPCMSENLAHKMLWGRTCVGSGLRPAFQFPRGSEGVAPSDLKSDNAMGKGVLHRGGSVWGRGCASWGCAFCHHGGRSAGPRVRIKDALAGSASGKVQHVERGKPRVCEDPRAGH